MAEIEIVDQNLRSLETIQEIIGVEEGHECSLDEALSHVLGFYRKFVPYN